MATILDSSGNPMASASPSGQVIPLFRDGLANLVSGAGTSIDRSVYDSWYFMPITPQEILAGYRSNWLIGKIVDVPAEDMVREWRDWQAGEGQIEKLEEIERRFDIIGKVQQGIAYGRLGGGAMLLGYGDADPSQPAPDATTDSLKYAHVFNRWEITAGDQDRDLTSPWFGQPKHFEINGDANRVKIHPSRMIVFKGQPVPAMAGASWHDVFWGDSILQRVDRAVKNAIKANDGFARLIDEAKIDVYRLSGFMQNLISDEAGVRKRVEYTDAGKSSLRGVYLDKDDEFTQRQLSLTGMPEMIESLLSVVAGAADIPATRLLGRAPQGMNATGEGDEKNYHTMIRSKQRLYLSPAVDRLDDVLIPSALGSRPDDVGYKWAPLSLPSEKEQAETNKLKAETIMLYVDGGLLPTSAIEKATQSMLSDDQWLPGLDKALAEAAAAGEEAGGSDDELGIVPVPGTPNGGKEADPNLAGSGGRPTQPPARRAANDAWMLEDWAAKPLYVRRDVINRAEIVKWAKSQGFTDIADDLHVTITYSRNPVDWMAMGESWRGKLEIEEGGPRLVEALGPDGKYKALLFTAYELISRNQEMRDKGASYDWPEYQPHISIQVGGDIDLAAVEPYRGKIVLGPEIFEEIRP